MRLLATADLHFNHPRSRPLAEGLIDEMNRAGGDVLLLVGDTAVADGDALEQALTRFRFPGPRLFVAGNHELWTNGGDSHALYARELPRRVRDLGWQWLETDPFRAGDVAVVGSVGWYDYSFAPPSLGIPRRFYEHKISPGAARHLGGYAELLDEARGDLSAGVLEIMARWNDGNFVKLHRSDEQFLDELLTRLDAQLAAVADARRVVAAVHHLPFHQLLPPSRSAQWDFARAFLGSERIGQVLLNHRNVLDVLCGHSHFAAEATVGHIRAVNIGSGYRNKTFRILEV
jgi:Icc-related predicted phosphoesterase